MISNEIWIHFYDPKSKKKSKKWKFFMTSKGIVLVDYKPKGETIIGVYYANKTEKKARKIIKGFLLLRLGRT